MERLEGQGAISIVKKGNYILLDLRKAKHGRIWEVPGGGMKEGETPEEAVRRETKEEVNIDIKNPIWLGAKNQGIHWINTEIDHFFLSNSFAGEPKAVDLEDKETLDVKWAKISDIIANMSYAQSFIPLTIICVSPFLYYWGREYLHKKKVAKTNV